MTVVMNVSCVFLLTTDMVKVSIFSMLHLYAPKGLIIMKKLKGKPF